MLTYVQIQKDKTLYVTQNHLFFSLLHPESDNDHGAEYESQHGSEQRVGPRIRARVGPTVKYRVERLMREPAMDNGWHNTTTIANRKPVCTLGEIQLEIALAIPCRIDSSRTTRIHSKNQVVMVVRFIQ